MSVWVCILVVFSLCVLKLKAFWKSKNIYDNKSFTLNLKSLIIDKVLELV